MNGRTVVIVSSTDDVHAVAVARALEARGTAHRILDFADFPEPNSISHSCGGGRPGAVRFGDLSLSEASEYSVWFRRPRQHGVSPTLHHDYADYARRMTRLTAISGLAAHARIVVNRTGPNDLIHHKPYQLELARVCGLAIPETLVTSAPDKARAFVERMGTCIIKSPGSWRYRLIETRPLSLASDFDFDLVRYCPVMLQSFVDGDREFRVTIIGNTVFAAAIDLSRSDFKTDSRLGEGRSVTASELPDQTQRALLRFHAASGLEYGAYDLRCDRNGVPHFLEVNPDGQYLFIEIETGLPISHAVAARLAEGVRPTY